MHVLNCFLPYLSGKFPLPSPLESIPETAELVLATACLNCSSTTILNSPRVALRRVKKDAPMVPRLTLYGSHISVRVVCDPYSKIAFSVSFVARRQLKWCSTRS